VTQEFIFFESSKSPLLIQSHELRIGGHRLLVPNWGNLDLLVATGLWPRLHRFISLS